MINISNYTNDDNPRWVPAPVPRPRPPTAAQVPDHRGGRSAGIRIWNALTLAVGVALDWLAYFVRRRGDRCFAMNDTEAYWWGWQITKARGGLGRRYRDTRFDTLAACTRCAGAGAWADAPCGACQGTGRISLGEVSQPWRDILRAACWASDVHVVTSVRYRHIVVLAVIRRPPAEPPGEATPAWPYLNRGGEPDGADPEEPALSGGLGNHRPFG